MKKIYFVWAIIIIILVTAVILRLNSKEDAPEQLVGNDRDEHGCLGSAGYSWCEIKQKCLRVWEEACELEIATTTPVLVPEVLVIKPQPAEIISSPFIVEGQALGTWFFEATLPVKLVDLNDQVILAHYGEAQSDWMTADPVPFKATLNFTTTATSGYLIISKDNPSGLPQNDASFRVPVNFK